MKMIRTAVLLGLATAAAAEGPAALKDLSFSGQIRAQTETTNIQSYATPALRRGQDFTLLRTRLGLQAKPGPGMTAFIQLQDSRTMGQEASVATNSNLVDLHQGFIELADLYGRPVDLKVGRMELKFGDQRLISPLDWSVVGRAWDGFDLRGRFGALTSDLFVTNVAETADAKRDQHFWGLYNTCRAVKDHEFDLYLIGRDFGNNSQTSEIATNSTGNLSDRTLGARGKGKHGPADYSAEAAWQFGRKAGMPVRAYAAAATAGWTFPGQWKPRLGGEIDYASGDQNPTDNRFNTFDPLFPLGHMLQGYSDQFSWRNGTDLKLVASAVPLADVPVELSYHHFQLAHAQDAWYGASTAAIVRDATGSSGKEIGHEVDLTARLAVRGALKLYLGATRFFAGTYVRRAAGGRNRDWAFLQATVDF